VEIYSCCIFSNDLRNVSVCVCFKGASSGIGKGTAVEFAGLGAHLALTGRNQENLQATADACVEAGTPQDKVFVFLCHSLTLCRFMSDISRPNYFYMCIYLNMSLLM